MRRLVLAAVLAALLVAPAAQAWTWPAGGAVLEPFLFDPAHPYAAGQHRGIVIGADAGGPVLAPAAGTVTFAGTVPSSGKSVTITTADGLAVTLTHLGALSVGKNAAVAEGDVVATAATAGDADFAQPYVHLGVRVAAEAQGYLDPLSLLPERVPAPPALVPPPPVEPAPAPAAQPEPAPAPVPAPEPEPVAPPSAVPAAAEPAPDPAPATATPVAAPEPAPAPAAAAPPEPEPVPAEPAAADAPAAPAAPATDSVEDAPAHGSTPPPATPRTAPPRADADALLSAAADDPPRHGSWTPRPAVAHAAAPPVDPRAADARFRPRAVPARVPARRASGSSAPVDGAAPVARLLPRHRHGGAPAPVLAAALAALLGVVAVRATRKAVPTMDAHALLRHHPDLLRQRPAAHRSLVHDHRGRHPRAPSPAARRGDVLPDGGRRARDEGLARR